MSWIGDLVELIRAVRASKLQRDDRKRDLYVKVTSGKLRYAALEAEGKKLGLSDSEIDFLCQHMLRVNRSLRMGGPALPKYSEDEKSRRDEIEVELRRILRMD